MFPPLGAALAVNIIAGAYFERLKIGRFIELVLQSGKEEYLAVIEVECQGMGSVRKIYQSVWMLVTFSFYFYAMFLFDMLGDTVGVHKAAWVLLAMVLAPAVMYICHYSYASWMERRAKQNTEAFTTALELHARDTARAVSLRLTSPVVPPDDAKQSEDGVELQETVNVLQNAAAAEP